MSFPDFDNEPQTNDEIQVEHLTSHDNQEDDFNFNVNVNQATNENFFQGQGGQSNFTGEQNIPYGQIEVVRIYFNVKGRRGRGKNFCEKK